MIIKSLKRQKKIKKRRIFNYNGVAHPKIYSNLDKAVGHYRRYEKVFKKNLHNLSRQRLLFLDL